MSLDVLFGLQEEAEEENLWQKLADGFRKQPESEKSAYIIELFYQLLNAYHENDMNVIPNFPEALTKETFAILRSDHELAIERLNPDMQYACFMSVPEDGINGYVEITPRLCDLFDLLSDETVLKIIFYAEALPRGYMITKQSISSKLGIEPEVVDSIIERFLWQGIMWEMTADTGEEPFPIYGYVHNIPLIGLLVLGTSVTHFIANREPDIDIWSKGPFRSPDSKTKRLNL